VKEEKDERCGNQEEERRKTCVREENNRENEEVEKFITLIGNLALALALNLNLKMCTSKQNFYNLSSCINA
jgi:hypothetical protein